MTEPNAAPDAAEIAAIRERLPASYVDSAPESWLREFEENYQALEDYAIIYGFDFLAHAPYDIRKLLAAVERLEATCESRQRINDQLIVERQEFIVENAKLRTTAECLEDENARLKADLNDITDSGFDYDIREGINIDDD